MRPIWKRVENIGCIKEDWSSRENLFNVPSKNRSVYVTSIEEED